MTGKSEITIQRYNGHFAGYRDGRRVTGHFTHRGHAEARVDKMNRLERVTTRACMTCGGSFRSKGPHNRMCPRCRTMSEGMI